MCIKCHHCWTVWSRAWDDFFSRLAAVTWPLGFLCWGWRRKELLFFKCGQRWAVLGHIFLFQGTTCTPLGGQEVFTRKFPGLWAVPLPHFQECKGTGHVPLEWVGLATICNLDSFCFLHKSIYLIYICIFISEYSILQPVYFTYCIFHEMVVIFLMTVILIKLFYCNVQIACYWTLNNFASPYFKQCNGEMDILFRLYLCAYTWLFI